MESNYRRTREQTMAQLLFGCCACICLTAILGVTIAALVQINHIAHELETPAPTQAPAVSSVGAVAASAAAAASSSTGSSARSALLKHGLAGLTHKEVKRGVQLDAALIEELAEEKPVAAAVKPASAKPKKVLSLAGRRAALKKKN